MCVTYAQAEKMPILMEIPFQRSIAETYARGDLVVNVMPQWKDAFCKMYVRIEQLVG